MKKCTDFLYARPSFLEGLARIMDLGNTLNEYNTSPTGKEADYIAISNDWAMVGQDMHNAIADFESEEVDKLTELKQVTDKQKKRKQGSEKQSATPQNHFSSPKTESMHKMVVSKASWSGPLPPPQAIQKFEEILPGAANRILEMTEKQSAHRIDMEKKVVERGSIHSLLGMIFGFIISVIAIVGGIYLIINDYVWPGVAMITLDLVGLASIFVYGSHSRRTERQQKYPELKD